jgi:hypothetical protein
MSLDEVKRRYASLIEFTDKILLQIENSKDEHICNLDFTKIYEIKNYEHVYCE